MRTPNEVTTILELQRKGWGAKRIARELGISKDTVKRYMQVGGWQLYGLPMWRKALDECSPWVAEQYLKHRGNADVVRQELARHKGFQVSLRTIERAVTPLGRQLRAVDRHFSARHSGMLARHSPRTSPGPALLLNVHSGLELLGQ